LPRNIVAAGPCLMISGAQVSCPAGLRRSDWSTGFTDNRMCGACTCGNPTGGDCGSMIIAVGADSQCANTTPAGYLRATSPQLCFPNGVGEFAPWLQFQGTPVVLTCAPSSAQSGALTATGPTTLCCI